MRLLRISGDLAWE
jgi:hypothetical protein